MIVKMDKAVASSSLNFAQRLYDKNIDLENRRRKSAQARVPSDPNTWQQMRENFETIIIEDHTFSEKNNVEFALWQLHYRRIEEFRAHYNAASATDSTARGGGNVRPDRASKIRSQFKTFLSEATGFYHDLILKIRAKHGLSIGQFYPEPEIHNMKEKNGKKSSNIKKGLMSCHRCLIYLGDLARYKGLYGEGESKSRDYAAASSYYLQAASLWPSSGNPHHQLAILATYSGDEMMAVYRYFRSLAAENPFSTARDNLIVAFEKNRQSYNQLHVDSKSPSGRGKGKVQLKEPIVDATSFDVERATEIRQIFKTFRVRFVRLNGILFTRTSLEAFEEILSLVSNALQELVSSGGFGTDAVEHGLFIVIVVSILIFTVNNVKGGVEGQSYADIVQNTVLVRNALMTFYELMGQLLKKCLEYPDPCSSFLLPGILVCMEWLASRSDVIRSETDEQSNFWIHCISLFNKLLSSGLVTVDDEEMSCFTDMKKKLNEDEVSEFQPALWEDFELRGFLPLEHAQTFLDFSRKHSDSKKDKVERVKRVLAAGKVITDMITVDHKKVRFDLKGNKFVIGDESNGAFTEILTNGQLVEGEDEDEVIVFKPTVVDNRSESVVSKEDEVLNLKNKDAISVPPDNYYKQNVVYSTLLPATNNFIGHFQPSTWSSGINIQGLNLSENGHVGKPRTSSFAVPIQQLNVRESDVVAPTGPDPYVVGRNTFLKGSMNRPVRHLGPPPGFSSVRSVQVNEHLGQNLPNDDYRWLDGHQSMRVGFQPLNLQSNLGSQFINNSVATSNFPFPGKQVAFGGEKLKNPNPQQQVPQQGQPTWKGNQFV